MKKITFFIFLNFLSLLIIAQEVDYVIDKPDDTSKDNFSPIPNPDYTCYLLNSTAFTLKQRDIRLSGTDIIYAKGSYGLTDNTTASVSISLAGTFIGSVKQQININDDLKLGVSASIGQLLSVPSDSVIFFAGGQTMVTLGDFQNNLTFGTGFYYTKSTFDIINEEKEFFLSNIYIGTQKQIGRRVYLIAEGIYFWNYNVISGAFGIKIIIKNNMALGFGVMPLSWNDPVLGHNNSEATVLPVATFRMLLDRH